MLLEIFYKKKIIRRFCPWERRTVRQTLAILEMFNKTKIVRLFVDVDQIIYPIEMEGLFSISEGAPG